MSHGPTQLFTTTIASAASTAGAIDFGTKTYRTLGVHHSGVGGAITVYGSMDGSTYKPVMERVNTASVQWATLVFQSAVSGSWATTEFPPFRYLQLVATGTVANGATIYVAAND